MAYTRKDITCINLLSVEEYNNAVATIPNIPIEQNGRWWLRSPGNYDALAAYVNGVGFVYYYGNDVDDEFGVRPAFRISHLSSNGCKPGDKITVGTKTICTVISDDVALADNVVSQHMFDRRSNNWDSSEMKEYINSEEFWRLL